MASTVSSEKTPLLKTAQRKTKASDYVLVIHGGAGTMSRANSTPEQQAAYKAALAQALQSVRYGLLLLYVLQGTEIYPRDIKC